MVTTYGGQGPTNLKHTGCSLVHGRIDLGRCRKPGKKANGAIVGPKRP